MASQITSGLTAEQLQAKTPAELIAIINGLETKKAAVDGEVHVRAGKYKLILRVSVKGAVSVYGMGRFPVTLYKEQWIALLSVAADILDFVQVNDSKLTNKEE